MCTLAIAVVACGGGAPKGAPCSSHSDCASDLQCLVGVCVDRCQSHIECGDGFVCSAAGLCEEVVSAIGDPCEREIDCGPGQACSLDALDSDDDGELAATCQASSPGAVTGGQCTSDDDCRSTTCVLGRCSQLCVDASDCPLSLGCTRIPRLLADDSAATFSGCLQPGGILETSVPLSQPLEEIVVPVPESARSFTVVAQVDDVSQNVGATRVIAPDGTLLFDTPDLPEEFFSNPIRYARAVGISTLMVPNTPAVPLETGIYRVEVGAFFSQGGVSATVPEVEVFYKLDSASTLDVHFYFLNLLDHPCNAAIGEATLDAASAQENVLFQTVYLDTLRAVFNTAGIQVGTVTYTDIPDRADLDGLQSMDLPRLLELSEGQTGIDIFLVRSITPDGIQALFGGAPGPPRMPGTRASGVAISVDTLCYRSWDSLARVTAHAAARQLGLFRNREPDGHEDPIPDSDLSSDNLMYFGEFGGTDLSAGQSDVLQRSAVLR